MSVAVLPLLYCLLLILLSASTTTAFYVSTSSSTRPINNAIINAQKSSSSSSIIPFAATTRRKATTNNGNDGDETNKGVTPSSSSSSHISSDSASSVSSSRRSMLLSTAKMASIALSTLSIIEPPNNVANAAETTTETTKTKFQANWKSVDGLNTYDETNKQKGNVVAFDDSSYKAMINDQSRTPLFYKTIDERIQSNPTQTMTVLDIGTGPYAIFAIRAAQAGAKRVYAIEANPKAAQIAKETVVNSGYDDVITIIEGYSTDLLSLPNDDKCDLIIAEIIGSIASEEGCVQTIYDASKKFAKEPNSSKTWIPQRVQTIACPASYTLHNLFGPPEFDWSKLNGEPVRFNCRDNGLQLLSGKPQIMEDIDFANIQNLYSSDKTKQQKSMKFVVDKDRVNENKSILITELKKNRLKSDEAERVAIETATSFSGIAFWPRLILNEGNDENEKNNNVSSF